MKKFFTVFVLALCIGVVSQQEISAKSTLNISTVGDWNNYVANYSKYNGWNIVIKNDIDFKNKRYNYKRTPVLSAGTYLNGNNHTFKNLNIDGNKSLISHNLGTIGNLRFDRAYINGGEASSIIKYNYGTINNIKINNSKLYGTRYTGFISKNYNTLKNVTTYNNYIVGQEYVGGLVALNSGYISGGSIKYRNRVKASMYGINMDKTVIKSRLAHNNKPYRDAPSATARKNLKGDYFGGIAGKNYNAYLTKSTISNTSIYADDSIGSVVGFNSYKADKKYNKKARVGLIDHVVSNNFYAVGGNRVGGLVGFQTNNNKINLKLLAPKTNGKSLRTRLTNSTMRGNLSINAANESGGAIGMNLYGLAHNVKVNVIKAHSNVKVYSEEAGGFVGDLEFGYVTNSSTNASVYAKKRQAAGFAGDSEGTIQRSTATGDVRGSREMAGFVGSNLGYVGRSKFRGNMYVSNGTKKGKAVFVGNFTAYKSGATKYKGFKLKGRYYKNSAGGKRFIKNKRVKNTFYGRGGTGN